jgi:hypothetical protein
MNWVDTAKATALAVLAGRAATAARASVDVPWSWNPHDVWLARASQPAAMSAQASKSGPTIARQLTHLDPTLRPR